MFKKITILLITAFCASTMFAQNVTVDIQNSVNGCGLVTDCSSSFVCYDITMEVDVNKSLDSYNIWVTYDNTVLSRVVSGDDGTCVIGNGGDTDLESSQGAYRVGGIPTAPYPLVANTPEVVHTMCFNILDLASFNGTIISVGGDKFGGALKTTVTFTDATFDDTVPESFLNVDPSNSECLFVPPVIMEVPQTTPEDVPVTFCPTTSDVNTGDVLTVSACSTPFNGTATTDGTCITYSPNANYNGMDSMCVQVCDQTGLCDSIIVPITITPVNDAPIAMDNSDITDEDTPVTIDVVSNDNDNLDPLGNIDPTTVAEISAPSNGSTSVDPVSGDITYTPNPGFNGTDVFTYVVCDDGNPLPSLCDTATVTVTINPVNDKPIAVDDADSTLEDIPVTIDVTNNDSDTDGNIDPTSVAEVTPPTNGSIAIDPITGDITYTPDPNFNGTDVFEYVVCDDGTPLPAQCDTAEVVITVNPSNDAPIALDDSDNTSEDTPVTVDVTDNDTDLDGNIDPTSVVVTSPPSNGTISVNPTTGDITYTPNPNFNGTDVFEYQVCDDGTPMPPLCDLAEVTITVDPVNDPPLAVDDNDSTPEETPIILDVLDNDSDIDGNLNPATVGIISPPSNGSISINPTTGEITYTPVLGFNGVDVFEYVVCDDGTPMPALCDTAEVTITVDPVNDPPTITEVPQTTLEDTPVTFCPTVSDPDGGDILTIASCGDPVNGTAVVDNVLGCITYTPDPNFNGLDLMCVVVCDNGTPQLCDSVIVPIRVLPVNDEPLAVNDIDTTDEDVPVVIDVVSNDNDDLDPLGNINPATVSEISSPSNGLISIDPVTGDITYTPDLDFNGMDTFTYAVCDDGNPTPALCDTADVFLLINPVQDCGTVTIEVLLEGAYDNGSLTTVLNEYHLLPGQDPAQSANPGAQFLGVAGAVGQPYNIAPFNHMGIEGDLYGDTITGAIAYPATVTDWVLVSLRETNNMPADEIWKCAGLLHSDGTVEFPATCPCLTVTNGTDYYVVVEHRNHLPVMSTVVQAANLDVAFDFTDNQSWLFDTGSPSEAAQKLMGTDFVMYAGNGNQPSGRTDVNSADNAVWITDFGTIFIYESGDHNLNADVNSVDRSLWLPNNGFFNLIQF